MKNLGFDQSDIECSPEVKLKTENLDQDPEYKDRIGKLISFRTSLNDSTDSNSFLEESLLTQDNTDCSCNKDTSLYKCCDNSSRMRASLATQEAEFTSGLDLAKNIISDGFYCFEKFCDKMEEKKNKRGDVTSSQEKKE
ncbi:unnamed protein product [Auanema sp. JU1783]|nr:unnamed protein product [Auanema sp. JU1783]